MIPRGAAPVEAPAHGVYTQCVSPLVQTCLTTTTTCRERLCGCSARSAGRADTGLLMMLQSKPHTSPAPGGCSLPSRPYWALSRPSGIC